MLSIVMCSMYFHRNQVQESELIIFPRQNDFNFFPYIYINIFNQMSDKKEEKFEISITPSKDTNLKSDTTALELDLKLAKVSI